MQPAAPSQRGFTLTELLVVIGLIAMLISLLMPVLTKARAAAQATVCLSNLRQMGTAWTTYTVENRGRLPDNLDWAAVPADTVWRAHWLGVLDSYNVRGGALLCPTADEPIPFNQNKGHGNVNYAWNGKFQSNGTPIRFSVTTYRVGSYGYNGYLTAGNGFGRDGKATRVTSVKPLSEVPAFMDATYFDFAPENGNQSNPAAAPPNLRGHDLPANAPDQCRFLIARHGRSINICMADGSARPVRLEDTYLLTWNTNWNKYRLPLPIN